MNSDVLLLATLALSLAGCGTSFDVSVANRCPEPLRVEFVVLSGSDEGSWLSTDVASDSVLAYSMRDGWRSKSKYLRFTRADSTSAEPFTVPLLEGERLIPQVNDFVVTLDDSGHLQVRRE